jgi:hypothetical protein
MIWIKRDRGDFRMTAALLVAMASVNLPLASNAANIPRQNLERMFDQMQRQSHWDISKPLLWGYFFVNPTREPLDRAAPLLSAMGYQVVKIYLADKKSASAPDQWWLHIERVEVHTVDSLDARNHEFNDFAASHGIAVYDGMDVGPASGTP